MVMVRYVNKATLYVCEDMFQRTLLVGVTLYVKYPNVEVTLCVLRAGCHHWPARTSQCGVCFKMTRQLRSQSS